MCQIWVRIDIRKRLIKLNMLSGKSQIDIVDDDVKKSEAYDSMKSSYNNLNEKIRLKNIEIRNLKDKIKNLESEKYGR